MKTASQYEIRTISEHAMRRLFAATGRSWEDFGPEDAQRCEWIEQALTMMTEQADVLPLERDNGKVPRRVVLTPREERLASVVGEKA